MKPTPARTLAKLLVLATTSLAAFAPALVATEAKAQPILSAEDRCRAELATGSRRYVERVLAARVRCQNRIILGKIPSSIDCLSGRGDDQLNKRLRRAEDKLTNVGAQCGGVNLALLGFPGLCTDDTPPTFDTGDFQKCTIIHTDEVTGDLLEDYYPPIMDFFRNMKSTCLRGTATDGFTSFRRTYRARERCLLGQDARLVDGDVQCREEILPYGPGTGSERVDREVARAYISLLSAIPVACVTVEIDEFGYQQSCEDPTGPPFTIFDLKQCLFGTNRKGVLDALALVFPTDPVCGDGIVQAGEECDQGPANSNTTPNACRTDCTNPRCHDGVVDNLRGEQCDDGNTDDTDCCVGECVNAVCGDGIRNCNEQCDNFPNNGNLPNQCRANCTNPRCGDTVTDAPTEQCDDGNVTSGDGCSALCIIEFCGDDQIQPGLGEQCDNGVDNSDTQPDACRENCKNPRCGDGVVDTGEVCDDGNSIDDDECSNSCSICGDGIKSPDEPCDGDSEQCGGGETCTDSCTCEAVCPGFGELTLYAGTGTTCATNADCPVGTCGSGRCRTVTRLDSGWVGLAHNSDINNAVRTRGFLQCDSHGPTCGQCNVIGVDPSTRACRCANNPRNVCDQPFVADQDDCGGAICNCYFGSPFPLSSGGTPACIINRFFENVTGTANVDTGSGAVTANLRTVVYLGPSTTDPCPTCGGTCSNAPSTLCVRNEDCPGGTCNLDPVADDGQRGGVCTSGLHQGLACDVGAFNTSFPAFPTGQSGGGYSLDCFPDSPNVSGSGLIIKLTQTTGEVSLESNLSCGGLSADKNCACLQCTGDTAVSCTGDADCLGQQGACEVRRVPGQFPCFSNTDCMSVNAGNCGSNGRCQFSPFITCTQNTDCSNANAGSCIPSTCSSFGNDAATAAEPNQCDDGVCVDKGGGFGECNSGPDDRFCSGVLKANGDGVLSCNSEDGCAPSSVGIDARPCSTIKRRSCFLDPITASGSPSPSTPVGAAVFCIPPTINSGINSVAGLPGPARVVNQTRTRTFCERDPNKQYIPGVGGCLD